MRDMRKRRRVSMCGSFTVEAAFLVPLLVFVLLLVVWLAIYLHDRIVIDDALFRICREGENYLIYCADPENGGLDRKAINSRSMFYALSGDAGKERYLEALVENRTQGKLFMMQKEEISVKKSGCYMNIRVRFRCLVPGWAGFFTGGDIGTYCEEYQMFCPVREEITRIGKVLLEK